MKIVANIIMFLTSMNLLASGGAPSTESHGPDISLLFAVINFCLFVFIIKKLTGKHIQDYFKNRSEKIKHDVENAKRIHEDARVQLAAVQQKVDQLDEKISLINEEMSASGESVKASIISQAEAMVVKIDADAKKLLDAKARFYQNKIKNEILEKAIALAEEDLQNQMSGVKGVTLANQWLVKKVDSAGEAL